MSRFKYQGPIVKEGDDLPNAGQSYIIAKGWPNNVPFKKPFGLMGIEMHRAIINSPGIRFEFVKNDLDS